MKRILPLLLVVALFLALASPTSAATVDPVQPCFIYIDAVDLQLLINENTGIAYCQATCDAGSGVTIVLTGILQQYKNGRWNDVKSWVSTGSMFVSISKQWAVYSGYQYRFNVTAKIYNSSGTLLESDTSSVSYYYPGT